jgi:hypothetical protein
MKLKWIGIGSREEKGLEEEIGRRNWNPNNWERKILSSGFFFFYFVLLCWWCFVVFLLRLVVIAKTRRRRSVLYGGDENLGWEKIWAVDVGQIKTQITLLFGKVRFH